MEPYRPSGEEPFVMKRVLITGAAGFVGRALVRALSGEYDVTGVDSRKADTVAIIWDFHDALPESLLPGSVDIIIHAGALVGCDARYSADDYYKVNVRSCRYLADYVEGAGAGRFVYLSTGGVYGEGDGPWPEDAPLAPADPYSVSKAEGEMELHRLSDIMNLVIARLFFPYGPGQSGRLIPDLAEEIQAGRPIHLNNAEGSPRINPIFIADVVAVLAGLIELTFSGVINLAGPDTLTIRELAESIGRHLGKSVDFDTGHRSPFDILGDNTRLHALMPDLEMMGVDQGLSQFLKTKAGLT